MLTIGITGIHGLIGWHLRTYLRGCEGVAVRGCDRSTFASGELMDAFVSGADAIVHLAGMNRGEGHKIEETNLHLTQAIVDACARTESRPHILFASSTHIKKDTAYGRSKRRCGELLQTWAEKNSALATIMILPHVFGECGRPFYNSVVATFCYQLAKGEVPEIIHDGGLELLHAQQVAREVNAIVRQKKGGRIRLQGQAMTVSELLQTLKDMAAQYGQHLIPELGTRLELDLFNTYRSYLFPDAYPVDLPVKRDERGTLFEVVKSLSGGQCFISSTKPDVTRGNHYHRHKVERFLVLRGEALIRIRKIFSARVDTFRVHGDKPQYVDIPTLHTHNITNIGNDELLTLFWAHEIFDPKNPDTHMEMV